MGDETAGPVPHDTRLVEAPTVDEVGLLAYLHRTGGRDGADVDSELEGGHPSRELDLEGGGREGVDGEQQRGGVEGFAPRKRQPPAQLAAAARLSPPEAQRRGVEANLDLFEDG